MSDHLKGRCLCGAIHYRARGPFSAVEICHCSQCARWTGHVFAGTSVPRGNLTITGEAHLRWYASSEGARRGFCKTCGSSLFWERIGSGEIDLAAGTLTPPTGLKVTGHIFTGDKSDYYTIPEGESRFRTHPRDDAAPEK